MKAPISPHRITEYARDMVHSIAEHEYLTAQAAREAFDKLVREQLKHGLYARLYTDGRFVVSVSGAAVNE